MGGRNTALPVVGRVREIEIIDGLLQRATGGVGGCLVFEGEAGIGKTRLIQEARRLGAERGCDLFFGACEELERTRPLAPVERALRSLNVATLGDWTNGELMLDALEERALHRPVLLILDDLHWADPATLLFARALSGRTEGNALSFIATTRLVQSHPDVAPVVDRLAADGARVHRVGPLSDEDVSELAHLIVGQGDDVRTRDVERAAGNPFYILEVLSAVREERPGEAAILPPSVRLTVLRRLAALPVDTYEVLQTAAMLGTTFAVDALAAVRRVSAMELMTALAPAVATGFIVDADDALAFRHDIVRSSLYEDVPEAIRRRVHREIADALIAAKMPASVIASHLMIGAQGTDMVAVEWLHEAGKGMFLRDVDECAALHRRAVELCEPGDMRDLMTLWLTDALRFGGRADEALPIEVALLEAGLDEHANLARYKYAQTLGYFGRFEDALEVIAPIAEDPTVSEEGRVGGGTVVGWVMFALSSFDEADRRAETAIARGGATGRGEGHSLRSYVENAKGNIERSIEHGLGAATAEDEILKESPYALPATRIPMALAYFAADRIGEAVELLHIGRRRVELAQSSDIVEYERHLCVVYYTAGDWVAATASSERIVELEPRQYAQLSAVDSHSGTPFAILARLDVHRNRLTAARDVLAKGDEACAVMRPSALNLLEWARGNLLEAEGDAPAAFHALMAMWEQLEPMRYFAGHWRLVAPDLVRVASAIGRTDVVRDVIAVVEEGARRAGGIGGGHVTAWRLCGGLEGNPELLVDAAEALASNERIVEAAQAAEEAGIAIGGTDPRAERFLSEALERYEVLGAMRDADRVRAAMRDVGIRRRARTTRHRPTHGWDALTPTELRVIELVAEGLTNAAIGDRLFISRRTVAAHLRNIFSKLGATSRAEVAAEAVRRSSR